MNADSQINKPNISQQISYVRLLKILWSRWYWIATTVTLSLIVAYIYLWYTPKSYSTSASLKFGIQDNGISQLIKGGISISSENSINTETYVIKSEQLLKTALSKLDYEVMYYIKGRVRATELYPYQPFEIQLVDELHSLNRGPYDIKLKSPKTVTITYHEGDKEKQIDINEGMEFKLGGYLLKLKKINIIDYSNYYFLINQPEDLLGRVYAGLSMKEVGRNTNIMGVYLTDTNPYFAQRTLNSIIETYLETDKTQKSSSASQIIDFINQQLDTLSHKVDIAQEKFQAFKNNKGVFNLTENSSSEFKRLNSYQEQLIKIKLQSLLFDQIEEQIKNNKEQVYINYNIDAGVEGLLGGLIEQLNKQIILLNEKSYLYNENSETIKIIKKQINEIKDAIVRNILAQRDRNTKTQQYITSVMEKSLGEIKDLSAEGKDYLNLERNYTINDKIYGDLVEKKLEAQISKAAVLSGASLVDEASLSLSPIAPQPQKIYVSFFLIGLVIGGGLIVLVRLINPFIYDKETVEGITNKPIIGIIREYPKDKFSPKNQILSLMSPKSVFAESVRSVRTNLSFLASEKQSKIICVTSEISGEGKSFITANLASTLALIDKKVIIIAADLRRSRLHKTFDTSNKIGLSTFLSKQSSLQDILFTTTVENLDFIPAGPTPPNPSELLHSIEMEELCKELSKKYDYVLIDTAPVGLVSDSIPLIRSSDIILFVIRSGVSKSSAASIPDRLAREYNFSNMVLVLNAFKDDPLYSSYYDTNYNESNYSSYYYYSDYSDYSYGSGYFEDERPKKWQLWRIVKNYIQKRKNDSEDE
jgi:capsular exopolysaccharide synthesis family protein